jgi:hypothetical protein
VPIDRAARVREARWIAVVSGGLALALLLAAAPLFEWASAGRPCETLRQTGRPCLGCGGTRALRLLLHGELAAAAGTNGLGAFSGVALGFVVMGSVLAFAEGRLRILRLMAWALGALAPFVIGGWLFAWWRLATAALGTS